MGRKKSNAQSAEMNVSQFASICDALRTGQLGSLNWRGVASDQHPQPACDVGPVEVAGGELVRGWPGCVNRQHGVGRTSEFDKQLYFAPNGFSKLLKQRTRTVSLISSRLGHDLHQHRRVFAALRTRIARMLDNEVVLVGEGMTLTPFLIRAAFWYGRPVVLLKWLPTKITASWLETVASANSQGQDVLEVFACSQASRTADRELKARRSMDQLVAQVADEVCVMNVSAHGNTKRAIDKRYAGVAATTLFLDSCPESVVKEYEDRGAVTWHLLDEKNSRRKYSGDDKFISHAAYPPKSDKQSVEIESIDFAEYLIHWTRAQAKSWVDETVIRALDRMLFADVSSEGLPESHSALGTLLKIVAQRRVLASNRSIRGKFKCVSWTEVPMPELISKRKFRSHRSTWDFEHYGISVRREVLNSLGAKKVKYGEEQDWSNLSENDRPYFQKRRSASGIDWSEEKEWRLLGDLDLTEVGPDEAFVFVKNSNEIAAIQELSWWPVVAVSDFSNCKN